MKQVAKMMIAGILSCLIFSSAWAIRVDMPKPGKEPVRKVTVSEKDSKVTMTLIVDTTFNSVKLESYSIFTRKKGSADKDVQPKVTKSHMSWTMVFTIPKADVDQTLMNLTYSDPSEKTDNDQDGGSTNVAHIKVSELYKYAKRAPTSSKPE